MLSEAAAIPDKLYFRIGEVAAICEVATYVLRFWESEFPQLKPNKGGTGQRLYRRRDVEMALRIRTLLYDQGFTIPGARQLLKMENRQKEPQLSLSIVESDASLTVDRKTLRRLQKEMRDLLNLLSAAPASTSRSSTMPAKSVVRPIRAVRTPAARLATPQRSNDLFE